MKTVTHLRGKLHSNLISKLLATIAVLALLALLYALHMPCLFRLLTGVPCAGCGMSRAMLAVLRLDFSAALSLHPLFWSIPVLYAYVLTDGALLKRRWADTLVLCLLLAGFVVLGLGRLLFPAWRAGL